MDRITVITRSLNVFVLGWLALLPLIGLVPSIYALISCRKILAGYHEAWNPASRYLKIGRALAQIGFVSSAILIFLILPALMIHFIG